MSLWMAPSVGQLVNTRRPHQPHRFQVTLLVVLSLWFSVIFYGAYYTQIEQKHSILKAQLFYREKRQEHKVSFLTAFQPFEETPFAKVTTPSLHFTENENVENLKGKVDNDLKLSKTGAQAASAIVNTNWPLSPKRWDSWKPRKSLRFSGSTNLASEHGGRGVTSSGINELFQIKRPKDYEEVIMTAGSGVPVIHRKVITPGVRLDPPRKGEYGQPVLVNPLALSQKERDIFDKGWATHHFNEFASLQISSQRDVPDYRNSKCRRNTAERDTQLPKASIVICFYNEALSVLVRSVFSILTRSPAHLLEEIILVDDFSDLDSLQKPLQKFVASVHKLRLLRMRSRSGLVRARLAGVREAKGQVLVFLDSHVECQKGWLTPLLHTITKNPTYAVTPEIDVIDQKMFSIHRATDNIGVLDFKSFSFKWTSTLPRIKKTLRHESDPISSPTMAGGLFAIRKDFFVTLGLYDPDLQLWGGENIELSLKLWLCGGGILIQPCSRVGHIFRDTSPYLKGEMVHVAVNNAARVAQVWADDFRKFFFKGTKINDKTALRELLFKNVEERMELRERLQCKTFSWYLENVYPELHIEGSGKFLGQIKSANGLCINSAKSSSESMLFLGDCQFAALWEYSRIGEIRGLDKCLGLSEEGDSLVAAHCDLETNSQLFQYIEEKLLYHPTSRSCLTVGEDGVSVLLGPCSKNLLSLWEWPQNPDHIPYVVENSDYHYTKEI